MLLGEYNYEANFVTGENSSRWAQVLFVIFVFDMSVVLMNLILGMAVSDIDGLQRTSAVKRMVNECCVVKTMEDCFTIIGRVAPFMDRYTVSIH